MALEFAEERRFVLNGQRAATTRTKLDKVAVDSLDVC